MIKNKIEYNHIPVKQSTFKGGLSALVHRWFRLTPSYGPELVVEMLSKLDCKKGEVVLDPFSGASTTLIESSFEGYDSYGFEINPLLHWVGKVSLNWKLNVDQLEKDLTEICKRFRIDAGKIGFDQLERNGLAVPNIHNPFRWWRKDVLTHLLILKRTIKDCSSTSEVRDFFMLALAGVLVPELTNVTLGRLQLHFIDREHDDIDTISIFSKHAQGMIEDIAKIRNIDTHGSSKIFNTDSVKLNGVSLEKPISCVITSPPYPNRYSYVWNTRPHLYMLDFFSNAKEAAELDKNTIGGTWGSATSILSKGIIEPAFAFFNDSITPIVEKIRTEDNLMANYVMKYFNLLALQISAMDNLPQANLRCAYVVGNSRVKGVYVETDVLLGEIFSGLGYKVDAIERIRKRNSGKDLHESIVYSTKR